MNRASEYHYYHLGLYETLLMCYAIEDKVYLDDPIQYNLAIQVIRYLIEVTNE